MKLVVEDKRYDEALSMIKNYLDDKRNEKMLNDKINVSITLNGIDGVLVDGSELYITDEYNKLSNDYEDVAVQLTLDMWNDYIRQIKNNIKFIRNKIEKDEEYLSVADQNNRKPEYIKKREESIKTGQKKLKPYLLLEKITGEITKKIANSEYEVAYEKLNERKQCEELLMAVLVFKNINGANYYFKCTGGYYGSPYCEGKLNTGLPRCYSKQ